MYVKPLKVSLKKLIMKYALITGGLGLIGTFIAKELIKTKK